MVVPFFPEVWPTNDGHDPGPAQHHIPELKNMQSVSGKSGKVSAWAVGAS